MDKKTKQALIQKAAEAKTGAYAPYSKFRVGAAILTHDGKIFTGANVENASYGLAICAERNAIFQAVFAGQRKISAVAVATDERGWITPCGACRQVISEFADGNTDIILTTVDGKSKTVKFKNIFPAPPTLQKLKK